MAFHAQDYLRLHWVGPCLWVKRELEQIPRSVPGVYVLHGYSPRLAAFPVFYAGQTGCLQRRLIEHLGLLGGAKPTIKAVQAEGPVYFSAASVANAGLRARVEAGLIVHLRPAFNSQTPSVPPVTVNLPPLTLFDKGVPA